MKRKLLIAILGIILTGSITITPHINAGSLVSVLCQNFQTNSNYFFDNFQKSEYINGFLTVHLKLKTPYNDGRIWSSGFNLFKSDCTHEFFEIPRTGLSVRPRMQFYSIRFNSARHFELWDDEQDIKLNCDSCALDLPEVLSDGSVYQTISYSGSIDGNVDFIHSDSFAIQGENHLKVPVLIIPGILGSIMKNLDVLVWPDVSKLVLDPKSEILDQLDMGQQGQSIQPFVNASEVLGSIDYGFGNFHYTDLLVQQFIKEGYVKDQTLFDFPYDWRMSASNIAEKLKDRIALVLKLSGSDRIDIIAHSLGGLVLKKYLANIAFDAKAESAINKVIFVGVPHLGSPEAAKMLLFGSSLDIPLLNGDELQKVSQNMPSVYQLLPSKGYFAKTSGYYDDLSDSRVHNILSYDQSVNLLRQLNKNEKLISDAENFHSDALDNMDFNGKKYQTYNIAGCGSLTLQTITKMYTGSDNIIKRIFHGPKYRLYNISGDGTVPLSSARHVNIPSQNMFYARHISHAQMLSNDSIGKAITSILENQTMTEQPEVTHSDQGCAMQGTVLSLKSDMDFVVQDLSTGKEIPRNTVIPEKKTGDDVHLIIPDSSKYKIVLKPKENLSQSVTDISIAKQQENKVQITNYFSISTHGKQLAIKIDNAKAAVESSSDGSSIDTVQPSGQYDQQDATPSELLHTAVQNAVTAQPTVNGLLDLTPLQNKVQFIFSHTANLSRFYYSLDDGDNWIVGDASHSAITVPKFTRSLSFYSEDTLGNQEETQTVMLRWTEDLNTPVIVQPSPPSPIVSLPIPTIEPIPTVGPEPTPAIDLGVPTGGPDASQPTLESTTAESTAIDSANNGKPSSGPEVTHSSDVVQPVVPPQVLAIQYPEKPLTLGPINITLQIPAPVPQTVSPIVIEKPARESHGFYWLIIKKLYGLLGFPSDLIIF